ncbi:hypothetical protein Tco_0001799 [Tanacetum coccineum]
MAWTTSNTRYESAGFAVTQETSPTDYQMNDDSIPDEQVHLSADKDTKNDHLPKADKRKDWWKPHDDDERPATPKPAWVISTSHIPNAVNNWANALASTYQAPAEKSLLRKIGDMRTFMNWYCQKVGKTELTQEDFEGQAYEVVKAFYPNVIHLQFQMKECHKMLTDQINWTNPEGDQDRIDINRPLPPSGPPGHVTIRTQFFFNKDLDYLRYSSKGCGQALSISKMKAAHYHDFRLELLIHEHMWIDDACTYDISASYVRTHMRILSVVSLKAYSRYGYDYLKEITLRIANYQEYQIAKKDFKNLYPSDFEDLNLLLLQVIRQRVEDLQLGIKSYKKQLNLTKPGWDATGYEYKHDYTIIKSLRKVVFPFSNNERKIMRFNEIYKFSDGMLTNIMEALDYKVKEYKVNRFNPRMNMQFWTAKDVTRSKEFIHAIERRLKTRRIFRNLECFVGGRVRDVDYKLI